MKGLPVVLNNGRKGMFGFDGEKALYLARKRDFQRSKLSETKQWQAWEAGAEVVKTTEEEQDARQRETERRDATAGFDTAMETAYKGCRKDGSLKRITL